MVSKYTPNRRSLNNAYTKATPKRCWHDTVRSAVRWVARLAHPGSVEIKSKDSILLKESWAYSQCALNEKAGLHTDSLISGEGMWLASWVLARSVKKEKKSM